MGAGDDADGPAASPIRLTPAGCSFSMAIARLLATSGDSGGSLGGAIAVPGALAPPASPCGDPGAVAADPAPAAGSDPEAPGASAAPGAPGVTSSSREIRACCAEMTGACTTGGSRFVVIADIACDALLVNAWTGWRHCAA